MVDKVEITEEAKNNPSVEEQAQQQRSSRVQEAPVRDF